MSFILIFKKVEKLVSIFIFSAILAFVTFWTVVLLDLPITTPGMAVLRFTPSSLKLLDREIVLLGVDSIVYSLLIWGSITLFKLVAGKRK